MVTRSARTGISGSPPVSPHSGTDQGDPRWCQPPHKLRLNNVSQINVEHTLQDFWRTRPRRRSSDRKVAGVAAAIARRYAIDPVLVRVAFVVATVSGGAGLLLYLLGWLLLPPERDQASGTEGARGPGRSSMSAVLAAVLVLMLIPAAALLDGHGWGILGLAVALGALFLLHRSRAGLGEIPGSRPVGTHQPGTQQPDAEPTTPSPAAADDPERPSPPAWDPLGAAPFAWDLPEIGRAHV